ncbi:uncharacterized protein LOC144881124 [Branchiostoma floridae x Branchiostoma japonicum]
MCRPVKKQSVSRSLACLQCAACEERTLRGHRTRLRVNMGVNACLCLLVLTSLVPELGAEIQASGLWPFNAQHGASDVTGHGNDGTATGTQLAPGPYGVDDGAFLFAGTNNSYIDIPNNGMLDVRTSFTILAHIYPTGEAGPIFNYVNNITIGQWALHFWQFSPQYLQMRPVRRDGYAPPASIVADVLQQNAWNYVGTTFDGATGMATIWNNGELANETHYDGIAEVASQYPVRVGVRDGDFKQRYFAGRIACLQLYGYAMSQEQIVAARDACRPPTAPVGLWPLNAQYGATDITGHGNSGSSIRVQSLAPGPYGDANGALQFEGTPYSYIDIPNNGWLDVRYSFTILAHIYPMGGAGPIFDYSGNNSAIWNWAVHFWQFSPQSLQMRPVGRDGYFSPDIEADVLQLNAWNYVGTTYDSETGMATIWNNGELANEKYIGVAEVATEFPVRVGVRDGDGRYFEGCISCLQLYDYAMSQEQISAARDVCKTPTSPVGLWPLNAQYGATDITGNENDGIATGTQLAPGPYGDDDGAFQFAGTANSYVDIPNNGWLDVRYSFTILAHIYPTGEAGPIFNYVNNITIGQWALHFWQLHTVNLQMRPVARDGYFSDGIGANVLQQNTWNYVGTTYDSETGNASLWINSELARENHIGVAEVASQYPVRVGVRDGDGRYFAGRIACLQLYNYPMTQEQIMAARYVCRLKTPINEEQATLAPPPPTGCSTGPPSYPCTALTCDNSAPYNDGDTCNYTCLLGCFGEGSTTVTCTNGTWVGSVPHCWEGLPPPSFPCTTRSGCSAPYREGDTCIYRCNDTCTGTPSVMTSTYRGGGRWTVPYWDGCKPWACKDYPPSYFCVNPICNSPPPFYNGYTCHYVCAPGCYGATGYITCMNGKWGEGQVPLCVPKGGCDPPPYIDCATIYDCSAPYFEGETCTYTCNDTCAGSPNTMTKTCFKGQWIGREWEGCRKYCRDPRSFPCAVRSGCDAPFTHGEICTYQCDMYRGCCGVPDSTTRECVDGTWVGPRWRGCHLRECGPPPDRYWATYTCNSPGAPYCTGTVCTYRCRPGCAAIPATATATCYNGRWYGKRKWKCKKGCGEPPDLPCTKRSGCAPAPFHSVVRYDYGESCYYRCYNEGGYAMEVSGDPVRTCQEDGQWSGTDLVCDCKDKKDCCRADIIFVLDYSASITQAVFEQVIAFVYDLVNRFDIGDQGAHVGVMHYNGLQWLDFNMNPSDTKADVLAMIDPGIPTTPHSITLTGAALTYVATTMLNINNRPGVQDVVIVLTDGFSQDSVTGPATILHNMGVQTFAIGVGSCVNDRALYEIANCRENVYKMRDFGFEPLQRAGITYNIHQQICCDKPRVRDTCPDNYVPFEGTCLRFSDRDDGQGFWSAERTCQAEGGRLVVIKSAALDAFIDTQMQIRELGDTWIGLWTPIPALPNQWTDGSTLLPSDYEDWYIWQTDQAPGEWCTDIRPRSPYDYTWNTDNCKGRKNYICQRVSAPCCPRPRITVPDPGYALSDNGTYILSPHVPCEEPVELEVSLS